MDKNPFNSAPSMSANDLATFQSLIHEYFKTQVASTSKPDSSFLSKTGGHQQTQPSSSNIDLTSAQLMQSVLAAGASDPMTQQILMASLISNGASSSIPSSTSSMNRQIPISKTQIATNKLSLSQQQYQQEAQIVQQAILNQLASAAVSGTFGSITSSNPLLNLGIDSLTNSQHNVDQNAILQAMLLASMTPSSSVDIQKPPVLKLTPNASNVRQTESFNDVLAKLSQDFSQSAQKGSVSKSNQDPKLNNDTLTANVLLANQIQHQQRLIQQQQQEAAIKIMQQIILNSSSVPQSTAQSEQMLLTSLLAISGITDQKQLAALMLQMGASPSTAFSMNNMTKNCSPGLTIRSKSSRQRGGSRSSGSRTGTPLRNSGQDDAISTCSSVGSSIEGTINDVLRKINNESPNSGADIPTNRKRRRSDSHTSSSNPNNSLTANLKRSRQPIVSTTLQELQGDTLIRYQAPIDQGWKRETIVQGIGPNGIHGEVIYKTPDGDICSSIEKVSQHLYNKKETANLAPSLSQDNFTFRTNIKLGDYFQCTTISGSSKSERDEQNTELVPFDLASLDKTNCKSVPQESTNEIKNRYMNFPGMKGLTDAQIDHAETNLKAFFNRLIEEQRKFEQARKTQQDSIIKSEKERIKTMKIENSLSAELKQQVEDLALLNVSQLPEMMNLEEMGLKMSSTCFANCLTVYEFLHSFAEVLVIEADSIPSLGTFQAALIDRNPKAMKSIMLVLTELIKYAIIDPGIRCPRLVTQTTGSRLHEFEITEEYASAVLRAFVVGRNGYEDEMSDWLNATLNQTQNQEEADESKDLSLNDQDDEDNAEEESSTAGHARLSLTVNFQDLDAEKQASLLEFICSEMVAHSGAIARELDRINDLQSNLRRDRFNIENKIRRIRFAISRKQLSQVALQHSQSTGDGPVDVVKSELETKKPKNPDSEASSRADDFENVETDEDLTKHLPAFRKNTIGDWEQELENPPSDEDDIDEISILEARIKQLQKNLAIKQRLIDECSFKMSGVFLGQDRYKRNYFLLGSLGGIFVEGLNPLEDDSDSNDFKESGFNVDWLLKEIEFKKQLSINRKTNTFFKKRRYVPKFLRKKPIEADEELDKKDANSLDDFEIDKKSLISHHLESKIKDENETEGKLSEFKTDISDAILDLSSSTHHELNEEIETTKREKSLHTFEELFSFCESVGVDDAMLATSALLYVTQTGLVEKLGANWQNAAVQYQTHLTCLVGEEYALEKLNGKRGSFTESILQLKVWLQQSTSDPNGQSQLEDFNAKLAKLVEEPEFLASIEDASEKNLERLKVQKPIKKSEPVHRQFPVPDESKNAWWRFSAPHTIQELTSVLAQRGARERGLLNSIQRSELVQPSTLVDISFAVNFKEASAIEFQHNFMNVRFRRGGKLKRPPIANVVIPAVTNNSSLFPPSQGGVSTDKITEGFIMNGISSSNEGLPASIREEYFSNLLKELNKNPSSLSNKDLEMISTSLAFRLGLLGPLDSIKPPVLTSYTVRFICECDFIEEIEGLEDKVLSSSLQSKGWQASPRVIDDDTVRLIPRGTIKKTRVDQYPIDLAKERLLALEDGLERRYFLPPFLDRENLMLDKKADEENTFIAATLQPTAELLQWRQKVKDASDVHALRCCAKTFVDSIAWHKSIMKVLCQICRKDNNEAELLLCDACDHGYHTYCFKPAMTVIPEGDWFCYDCQSKASSDNAEASVEKRRRLCFICGIEGYTQTATESGEIQRIGSRLACCELCSRCAHPDCLKPSLVRIPRRWLCAACAGLRDFERETPAKKKSESSLEPDQNGKKRKNKKIKDEFVLSNDESNQANVSDTNEELSTFESSPINGKINVSKKPLKPKQLSSTNIESPKKTKSTKKLVKKVESATSLEDNLLETEHSSIEPLYEAKESSEKFVHVKKCLKSKKKKISGNNELDDKDHVVDEPYVEFLSSEELSDHKKSRKRLLDNNQTTSHLNGTVKHSRNGSLKSNQLEYCRLATLSMISHPASLPFRYPVNLRLVPMYKKIIKKPMDLSTVLKRASSSSRISYKCFNDWRDDMLQIFENCKIFNEDDSDLGKAGSQLREIFERYFSQPGVIYHDQDLPVELQIDPTIIETTEHKKSASEELNGEQRLCSTPSPPTVDFEGATSLPNSKEFDATPLNDNFIPKKSKLETKTKVFSDESIESGISDSGNCSPPPPKLTQSGPCFGDSSDI